MKCLSKTQRNPKTKISEIHKEKIKSQDKIVNTGRPERTVVYYKNKCSWYVAYAYNPGSGRGNQEDPHKYKTTLFYVVSSKHPE